MKLNKFGFNSICREHDLRVCNQLRRARCALQDSRPGQLDDRSHLPLRFMRLRLRPPVAFIDAGSVSRSAFRLASWIDCENELLLACRSASFAICSNFSSTADTFELARTRHTTFKWTGITVNFRAGYFRAGWNKEGLPAAALSDRWCFALCQSLS